MLTRFDDFDRTFAAMDQLRRRMDRLFEDHEPAHGRRRDTLRSDLADEVERAWSGRFPRITFADAGASLVLQADVPGLADEDVQLAIHQDVLTVSGERRSTVPEGYLAHRQERAPLKFARSFTLPVKVDPEKSTATIKHGVLTITLAKAASVTPKQITVKAQ
jgi:HSP20 family protein